MSKLALAIDFGTSRTKVAFRDNNGTVQVLKFADNDYLPSIFYLPTETKEILIGEDAEEALEDDAGAVIHCLKRKLLENKSVRFSRERSEGVEDLFKYLFKAIQEKALNEIQVFEGIPPETLILTVPANAPGTLNALLTQAAEEAGFMSATVMQEPIAVARGWLLDHKINTKALVVLDCGGGTTDWALVEKTGERLHLGSNRLPEAINIGGMDVDEALLNWVREYHPDIFNIRHPERLKSQLRIWKEATLNGKDPKPIRIKGKPLILNEKVLKQVYYQHYLDIVIPRFDQYVKQIIKAFPDIEILLSGGNATPWLQERVQEISEHVHLPSSRIHMVVVGSLTDQITTKANSKNTNVFPTISDNLFALEDIKTTPLQRLNIGDRLAKSGDPRSGVGLNEKGLPDIDWVGIPEGVFIFGDDELESTCTTKSYYISRYPITNIQFDVFIKGGAYDEQRWWQDIRNQQPAESLWPIVNRPRVNISWYEAIAYTRWLSEQLNYEVCLPTEQQWEKAARGTDGRKYPWGNVYKEGYANVNEEKTKNGIWFLNQTTSVGIYPMGVSPYGVMDMAGNIREWCLNKANSPVKPRIDSSDVVRILRGGSWYGDVNDAQSDNCEYDYPDLQHNDVGFRIVCEKPHCRETEC